MKGILFFATLAFTSISAVAAPLERPPQYVLISFDGSNSLNFWSESQRLANENKARFSYFISGVYFVPRSKSPVYQPPRHKRGYSDIGWAKEDPKDIQRRTEFVWSALSKKFDIGSHANGHFDGGRWSYEEWKVEFNFFHRFVEKVFDLNPKSKTSFSSEWPQTLRQNILGFRAPLLAYNDNTLRVLKDFRYLYDASGQNAGEWPQEMKNGIWDLGLARIQLAGSKRQTVAMDYNIFFGQCNGRFSKNGKECQGLSETRVRQFEEQTYRSYMRALQKRYYGNRAPFSVGHHFSIWNRGAYWKALQRFIRDACRMPEVQCITHKDMVGVMKSYLRKYGPQVTEQLNAGNFVRSGLSQALAINMQSRFLETPLNIPEIPETFEKMMLKGDLPGAHSAETLEENLESYRVQ